MNSTKPDLKKVLGAVTLLVAAIVLVKVYSTTIEINQLGALTSGTDTLAAASVNIKLASTTPAIQFVAPGSQQVRLVEYTVTNGVTPFQAEYINVNVSQTPSSPSYITAMRTYVNGVQVNVPKTAATTAALYFAAGQSKTVTMYVDIATTAPDGVQLVGSMTGIGAAPSTSLAISWVQPTLGNPATVYKSILIPGGCTSTAGYSMTLGVPCSLAAVVKMEAPTYRLVKSGLSNTINAVVYTVPITITPMRNATIGKTVQLADTATGANGLAYVFQKAASPTVSDTKSTASATLTSGDTPTIGDAYALTANTAHRFTVTITLSAPSSLNTYYRVALKQLRMSVLENAATNTTNLDLVPATSYQSGFQFINN